MAFTYTEGGTSDRDRSRLYLYDVDSANPLFSDEEWDDFLATEGGITGAVAMAAETMANRSAVKMDFGADGARFAAAKVYDHWKSQAVTWRKKAQGITVVMPTRVDGYSQDIDSDEVDGSPT